MCEEEDDEEEEEEEERKKKRQKKSTHQFIGKEVLRRPLTQPHTHAFAL
jgi:hypothetical protein